MQFWKALSEVFFGGQEEPPDEPTVEDYEEAQAADRIMSGEMEDDWNAGVAMGTIPETPRGYESGDTDPEHPSVNAEPWYRKLFPW